MTGPSKDWKEVIGPDEEARFAALSAQLQTMAKDRDQGSATGRALHVKAHVGFAATLEIAAGLPEHAAQGVFATPGTKRAYVRFSNGGGRRIGDREPDLRGMAVKILGVEGPKALGDATTQDFLAIDVMKLPFKSLDEFAAILRASRLPPSGLVPALIRDLGLFRALGLVGRVAGGLRGKRGSILDLTYCTVAPVAWGPWAARVRFRPTHSPDTAARAQKDPDYLRREALGRGERGGLVFEVAAQFFEDEVRTPIERADVDWASPWLPVGTLRLEARAAAAEKLDALVESLSFDPWHALVAHRPLGESMRARKVAYYPSVQHRGARPEPDGSEWPGS